MCRTIPNKSSEAVASATEAGQQPSHGVIALTSDDIVLITSMQVHQRQTVIPVNSARLPARRSARRTQVTPQGMASMPPYVGFAVAEKWISHLPCVCQQVRKIVKKTGRSRQNCPSRLRSRCLKECAGLHVLPDSQIVVKKCPLPGIE